MGHSLASDYTCDHVALCCYPAERQWATWKLMGGSIATSFLTVGIYLLGCPRDWV